MFQPPFTDIQKDYLAYTYNTQEKKITQTSVLSVRENNFTLTPSRDLPEYVYGTDGIATHTPYICLTILPNLAPSPDFRATLSSAEPGSRFLDQCGGIWEKLPDQTTPNNIKCLKVFCPLGLHEKKPERFFDLITAQGKQTRGHYNGLTEPVLLVALGEQKSVSLETPSYTLEDKDLNTPVSDLPPPPQPVVIDEHLLDQAEKAVKGFGLSVREIVKAANTNADIALAYVKAYQNGVVIPPVKPDEMKVEPTYFKRLLRCLQAGRTVMLVGPAGCGKTFSALWAADVLGYKPYEMDITDATTPEQLWGRIGITTEGDVFRPGIIPEAMQDPSGMIIFNEWDACNERVAMTLQSFLERRTPRSGSAPDSDKRRFVAEGPLPVVLTANTIGTGPSRKYTGRNRLDLATQDRVTIIQCGYENEALIVVAKGFAKRTADRVVEWAKKARLVIEKHDMALDLSTRRLIDISEAVDKFRLTMKDAIREEFLERLDDADRKLIEKEAA